MIIEDNFKSKLHFINHLRDTNMTSISMTDATPPGKGFISLSRSFSFDMKGKDYIDSNARSAAKNVGPLCCAR